MVCAGAGGKVSASLLFQVVGTSLPFAQARQKIALLPPSSHLPPYTSTNLHIIPKTPFSHHLTPPLHHQLPRTRLHRIHPSNRILQRAPDAGRMQAYLAGR